METTRPKQPLLLRLDDDVHMALKIQATRERKSMQQYVLQLIKQSLEEKGIDIYGED